MAHWRLTPQHKKGNQMAEDKKVITIDDVEYTEDQLDDKQKMLVNHINSLQQKINNAEFNLDQLRVGQDGFVRMLKESLKETDKAA